MLVVLVPSRWQVTALLGVFRFRFGMPMMSVRVMRTVPAWFRDRKLFVCRLAATLRAFDHCNELLRVAAAQRRSEYRRDAEIRDESDSKHCEAMTPNELPSRTILLLNRKTDQFHLIRDKLMKLNSSHKTIASAVVTTSCATDGPMVGHVLI